MTRTAPLPIEAVLPALRAALRERNRAVVQAPPGAGKSTLLPLALIDEPWLAGRRLIMLEPRRLAARAVSRWMAHLLGEPLGRRVGYRIRLDSCVSPATRIEVVTEGILTRMLQDDPTLDGVGGVIFDEFHERSLQADLGLALCLDTQQQLRPDLRLVLMSATLDAVALAAFLGGAPLITAEGRRFHVDTIHADRPPPHVETAVAATVRRALREHDGDMLVFLPGQAEIRRVQGLIEDAGLDPQTRVLPLYGELPAERQEEAIAPSSGGSRKVVLATSIAETSLTIEGVRIVIDSGLARRSRFDPGTGMSRLTTTRVSRAAADQRRGRAGRIADGVCYRMWTAAMEERLIGQTPPEIVEADLAPLALELAAWGIGDPGELRWIDPPPAASYAQARDLLQALGALDTAGRITTHGRAMIRLGLHPRLAHMIAAAGDEDSHAAACALAALLSERDLLRFQPRLRQADIGLRLAVLRGERQPPVGAEIDRGARDRARLLARSWQGQRRDDRPQSAPPAADPLADDHTAGALLALAYPDRIARRRGDERGRFLLANGRGATLPDTDTLAGANFLVVADLDGGDRDGRIRLAAPIDRTAIEARCADRLVERPQVGWDARTQSVLMRRQWLLGELVIDERPMDRPDAALVCRAMIDGLRALGIDALPWDAATRNWQARVLLLRGLGTADPDGNWPDVSDTALLASMEDWLGPWLDGISRRDHLARLDLRSALAALLTHRQRQRLDEWLPTHFTVPSGSRIALDYTSGRPVLAVRLQEVFGLADSPRLAGGRVPVTMELLSPAGRPVQVTGDLAGFWSRSYHDVRKEMKGRYPKHYWPEDPYTAIATRRTRPS